MFVSNNMLSVDVEDWFHILDSPAVPAINEWSCLPLRAEKSMEKILSVLEETNTKATFFWLAWMAQRLPKLVRKCQDAGHEIASHGFAHVLPYEVGCRAFSEDIKKAKLILEEITGQPVYGYRAPGFGITEKAPWAFGEIKSAGYLYDSSVFPASRGHGGLICSPVDPFIIQTDYGVLPEIPMSTVELFGKRVSFFGGGYLRLAPRLVIDWGIKQLHKECRPLVVYVHPREFDPDHPRLPLTLLRRFKCYVNLKSTLPKIKWLCENFSFCTIHQMVESLLSAFNDGNSEGFSVVDFNVKGDFYVSPGLSEVREE